MNLEDIGIGIDDLYRNDDGDLRMKPDDICPHADPPEAECEFCFWFDGDSESCRYTQEERDESIKH